MNDRPRAHHRSRRPGTIPVVLGVVAALGIASIGEARTRPEEPLATLLAILPETPRAGIVVLAEGRWSGRSGDLLTERERRDLLNALARVARPSLLHALGEIAETPADAHLSPAALHVVERIADGEALELLAPLALAGLGEARPDRARRSAFAAALRAVLSRDPACAARVAPLARDSHAGLFADWVREVARLESEVSLSALADLVPVVPGGEILVLGELARCAARLPHPLELDLEPVLRRGLAAADVAVVQAAAEGVRAAEVRTLAPELARLVEHADPGVSQASLKALREFSGRQIGRDSEAWLAWLAAELRWWEVESAGVLDEAQRAAPGLATHRILELSLRRFHRHELAAPMARCLRRSEEDVLVLTIHALGHLGSHRAIQPLIPMLEDERVEVIKAAWHALKRITGDSLGPFAAEWRGRYPG